MYRSSLPSVLPIKDTLSSENVPALGFSVTVTISSLTTSTGRAAAATSASIDSAKGDDSSSVSSSPILTPICLSSSSSDIFLSLSSILKLVLINFPVSGVLISLFYMKHFITASEEHYNKIKKQNYPELERVLSQFKNQLNEGLVKVVNSVMATKDAN